MEVRSFICSPSMPFCFVLLSSSLLGSWKSVLARSVNGDGGTEETVNYLLRRLVGGVALGLRYHGNLALDPKEISEGHSMPKFKQLLMKAHDLKILNERSVVQLMEQVGFQVVVAEDSVMLSLEHVVEIVDSCSIMVGVHWAGLTHELFLPDGGVLVQIVPLGMEWGAETYCSRPGTVMGLWQLKYKIEPEESSLSEIYKPNHPVIADPESVFAKGYNAAARALDFNKQDMKIDLARFKKTLV